MSSNGPALLAAAAGVGFGHAILPDHWVPLSVLGRTRRYPLSKVARLSGLAGVAHVIVSMTLGAVIIAVGLQFRSAVESAQDAIIGAVLIATGVGFVVLELTGHGHVHAHDHAHDHGDHAHDHRGSAHADDGWGHAHGHEHGARALAYDDSAHAHAHAHPHGGGGDSHVHGVNRRDGASSGGGLRGIAAVMVPFGAAASPDLTILPVFLAAAAAGIATAIGSLVIFGAVTVGTIVGLTLAATRGGYQLRGEWLERWGNVLTALVLVVIGALVFAGII
jgi:nickel/cobalt transporter (NicO) family protein